MGMTDPFADMLTRIRNAGKAKHNSVDIPGAKLKFEVVKLLKDEGFVKNFKLIKDGKQGILRVYLKYTENNKHAIYGITRVSKPGRRVYIKGKAIKSILNGLGLAILSTSKGVVTDKKAKELNVGGEFLCKVW
ncbi:MAG: 30S ribosomal protein S8 [Desulfobacterales bacterium]|nr:30S ribosomal protein S8 [Desulfobacterales bacterium]MBF0396458.1 30S ribosomal protein S8 [Desulfobacterales bacterium]